MSTRCGRDTPILSDPQPAESRLEVGSRSAILFAAGVLIWQLLWLSQSAPRLKPDPFYWWLALLSALLSIASGLRGWTMVSLLSLSLGGMAGLAVKGSTVLRCLVFWSYWAGFVQAALDFKSRPGRLRRVVLSSYLVLFGLQLVLVAGEVAMRVLAASDDTTRIPCLSYNNSLWKMASLYDDETNSQGYRDPERPQFKPDGVKRLLFLGDSVTFGLGVAAADTFVRQVEAQLGPPFEALNLSLVGANLDREYRELCTRGLFYEPDAVIWVFFPNDIESIGWTPGFMGIHPALDNLYENWLFYAYLKMQVNNTLGALAIRPRYLNSLQLAFSGPGYQAFAESLGRLNAWCRRQHKPLFIVLFPFVEELEDYPLVEAHQKVAATARELGVPCLDLLPVLQGQKTVSLQLNPHFDHHPNTLANRLAAQAITPFLRSYLLPAGH